MLRRTQLRDFLNSRAVGSGIPGDGKAVEAPMLVFGEMSRTQDSATCQKENRKYEPSFVKNQSNCLV